MASANLFSLIPAFFYQETKYYNLYNKSQVPNRNYQLFPAMLPYNKRFFADYPIILSNLKTNTKRGASYAQQRQACFRMCRRHTGQRVGLNS